MHLIRGDIVLMMWATVGKNIDMSTGFPVRRFIPESEADCPRWVTIMITLQEHA
jgi:hypothetical protein